MDIREKCQPHLWLLTGTGEGHVFAESLLKEGWKITVSVVSDRASIPYEKLNLEKILSFTIYRFFIEDDIRKIQHLKMYANFNDYAISVSVMFTIFSSSSQTILSFREVLKSLMIRERNFGNGNRYNQATF